MRCFFKTFQFLFVFILILCISCNTSQKKVPLFELMKNTGINFQNNVRDGKHDNSFVFRNFYNGGGVAIGDLNNDGLPDVFLTSNMGENKIYLNKGNFKFDDVTAKSGIRQDSEWCTGVVLVDINHDGWLDIFVCSSGNMTTGNRRNKLYINNHNMTFTESAAKYGLDTRGYTTQVVFFDYDHDGDLDCFMINNSPIPINTLNNSNRRDLPDSLWPVANFLKGGGDHLYRNDNGHFHEVTGQAGIHGSLISFGLGAMVCDVNGDGYPDIYVANDSYERDYLYINQKNGTFKDEIENYMQHISMSSMGVDMADINNDGYPDFFTTDMLPENDYRLQTTGSFDNIELFRNKLKAGFYYQYVKNCLQLNNGSGKFMDIANYSGVSATDWSWGALMFDADNDGYNDIYVCNGVNRDVMNLDFLNFFANDVVQKMVLTGKKAGIDEVLNKIPQHPLANRAFRNLGNLQFADAGNSWGFTQPSFSNGAAYGDLDNDGDLDLVVNNENGPAFVYRNNARQLNRNHYIGVFLKGDSLNTFAVGSQVRVYEGKQILDRVVMPSRGFQSSMDYKQIIGLGKLTTIDSLEVIWPDNSYSRYYHPGTDTVLVLQEPLFNKKFVNQAPNLPPKTLLEPVPSHFDKHTEDDYVDFYYERNIPEMLSREGPKATVGDVNGDGLEDIFIGGTAGHPGQLYLQTPDGKFVKKKEPSIDQFMDFEDEAVLFFDADGDGDLDLYIGPGGNNSPPDSRPMQERLFKNDGKGNFTLDAAAFPSNGENIGVALAYDFNHDGKLDLFVGGRSVPRDYGSAPESYLYINDGNGHFRDVAKTKAPGLATIGMVTGAVMADVTGDGAQELVVTGEWMAPRIFALKGDRLEEVKTNLSNMDGLWQTVTAADVNGDGKTDLILGNMGENFYLHPDETHPVKLWMNDFDGNGTVEKILSFTVDGKDMPVFLKQDLEPQFPAIKQQHLSYADFATKSIQDLFSPEQISSCVVKTFNYTPSCIAINRGNGKFDIEKLPVMAQLSSVNAIQSLDLNQDGYPDLVAGGNQYGFPPQFGRLDASFGDVMLNDGKGNFSWRNPAKSGLQVEGEIRDLKVIKEKDGTYLLFLRNDDYPVLYKLTEWKAGLQQK